MKTLYLHVGTHKTGTTSIQSYLSDARDALRQGGLHFVEPRAVRSRDGKTKKRRNSAHLAHHFIRPELMTAIRWRAYDKRADFDRMCAESVESTSEIIRDSDCDLLVISSESFCFMRTSEEREKLKAFFASLDCEVRPVLVLRSEESWRASFNSQLAKSDYVDCRAVVTDPALRVDSDWYYDTDEIVRFWSDIGTPSVISYDEQMATAGTIIPAFMRALNVTPPAGYESYFLNTRKT